MQIIDNKNNWSNPDDRSGNNRSTDTRPRNIFIGTLLILAGILWLLRNFELIPWSVFDVIVSWQMLLVVIGVYLLTLRRWVGGGIIVTIGLFLLISNSLGLYISFSKIIFPLVLMAGGAAIILSINRQK